MTEKKLNATLCLTNKVIASVVDQAISDGAATSRAELIQAAVVPFLEALGYTVDLPSRKLTSEQKAEIIRDYIPRVNGQELATKYGITLTHLVHTYRREKERLAKIEASKPKVKPKAKKKSA